MVLSQEEIDGCRDAFLAFDKDRSGTIDVWELRQVLEAMGQKPTEVREERGGGGGGGRGGEAKRGGEWEGGGGRGMGREGWA